jgi:hypothetical protein
VLGVDYLDAPQPHGKWCNVARLDESSHESFHAHLPSEEGISIMIGVGLSREEKIKLGFQELARFAKEGRIFQGDDVCSPEEIWQALQPQVFEQKAAKGSTHHNVSITGTARIVSNLEDFASDLTGLDDENPAVHRNN